MTTPRSMDLRVRVLAAVAGGLSHRQAEARFCVSAASISRWRAREREQGDARPRPMGGDQRSQTIESHGELILSLYEATPDITLQAWAEVETAAREKRERRGGFEDGAVLVGTEWPAAVRTAHRVPAMVTLRSLGKVASDQNRIIASYNALLSSLEGVALEMGGRNFTLRLAREGVILDQEMVSIAPAQLELPLDD